MKHVLLLAALLVGSSVATSPLNMLMTLDCTGTFHGPGGGTVQAPWLPALMTQFQSDVVAQAKMACPSLTATQITDFFSFPQMMIYALTGGVPINIPGCSNLITFDGILGGTLSMNLPSTCTAANFASSGCSFQYTLPNNGGAGTFVMQQCPSSSMPYISITGSGPVANQLLMPCTSNSQCTMSGFTCQNPLASVDTTWWTSFLTSAGFSTNCLTFSSFLSAMMGPWGSLYGQSGVTQPTVCMPSGLFTDTSGTVLQNLFGSCTSASVGTQTVVNCPFSNGPTSPVSNSDLMGQSFTVPSIPTCAGSAGVDCSGNMYFNLGPKFTMGMSMGFMQQLKTAFETYIVNTASWTGSGSSCGVSAANQAAFWLSYAFWSLDGYWAAFVAGSGQPAPVPTSLIGQYVQNVGSGQVSLPASCSYASLVSGAACNLEYTGLTTLLGTQDTTAAYLGISQCTGTNRDFSMEAHITGYVVTMLNSLTTCTSNSACSNGFVCTDLTQNLGGLLTADMWKSIVNSASNQPQSTYQFLMNYLKGTDGVSYGTSVCTPNINYINSNAQTWANGAATISSSPNLVTINGLTTYSQFTCPADQISSFNASTGSILMPSMWALVFGLLAAMLM